MSKLSSKVQKCPNCPRFSKLPYLKKYKKSNFLETNENNVEESWKIYIKKKNLSILNLSLYFQDLAADIYSKKSMLSYLTKLNEDVIFLYFPELKLLSKTYFLIYKCRPSKVTNHVACLLLTNLYCRDVTVRVSS